MEIPFQSIKPIFKKDDVSFKGNLKNMFVLTVMKKSPF